MSYRCPKCSEEHFVIGVLARHVLEKHPDLAELIVSQGLELHMLLGKWRE